MTIRWSVGETVSWIAYRDEAWSKSMAWSYDWPLLPPDDLLEPLEELARGVQRQVLNSTASAAARFVHETRCKAVTLARALHGDLAGHEEHAAKINSALVELQRTVEQQRLPVYAVQEGNTYASRTAIDPDFFTRFPLSIHIHGRIAPLRPGTRYRGPCFEDAAFEAADVRKLWPPPPPAVPGAYDWLLAEAKRYFDQYKRPANQADIVKQCVAAVGGQIRETTALHRTLPDELRYLRGKQRRKQS
jgi:hypothetical protein